MIFRVRSAKAVKITDMDLIKRLGVIVGCFVLLLLIRTLVAPPIVITGKPPFFALSILDLEAQRVLFMDWNFDFDMHVIFH